MDFFGKNTKITRVEDEDGYSWKVLIRGKNNERLTLAFDEEPTDYPIGWPVQVKISVTQTKLVTT